MYVFGEKEKNSTLVYPGLHYAHENLDFACIFFGKFLFEHKIRFAVEKTKNFSGQFQRTILCRYQKNASHTVSIYGNCMISIFFKKQNLGFVITSLFN